MLKKSKSKLVYISIILILILLSCGTIFINNSSNNKKVHAETTTLSVNKRTSFGVLFCFHFYSAC